MTVLEPVSSESARAARERIAGIAARTPLVRLHVEAPAEIWLKLENLQPIGSFKIRGAASRMLAATPQELERGVWTASAGNMAQGVAWCARELGVSCAVVVPEGAPAAKVDAVRRLGARVLEVPFADWYGIFATRAYPGMEGLFIHAFSDAQVMAGNATIALEILEDLGTVDAVLMPYGGGGLACGMAALLRDACPAARRLAVEVETAAPLSAAFAAGRIVAIEHQRSFVDGIGGPRLSPEMWELARELLDGSCVVSLEEIGHALRLLLERNHVLAEGAGAAPVAAGLGGQAGSGRIVCVVSGGNIDLDVVEQILGSR